jgi:hypothetical protein
MTETSIEKLNDMITVQRIIGSATLFAKLDQIRFAKRSQLVGYRRLTHSHTGSNIADTQLSSRQSRDNPNATRIAERLKSLSQVGRRQAIDKLFLCPSNPILIKMIVSTCVTSSSGHFALLCKV